MSFTYGTNGIPIPSGKEYCINLIDKELIIKQLNLAKEQNVDGICVFMHWGEEYKTVPNNEQNELANFLFENGADIILGSHPHVLQRMEKRNITLSDGTTKDGFIIYSLGNFVSGQVKENTKNSIILNIIITKKGTGEITIENVKYTPIYTYQNINKEKQKYKILDIQKAIYNYENNNQYISANDYILLKNEYDKIISIVGGEI